MKNKLVQFAGDHLSEILIVVGGLGMVGSTVLAVRETPTVIRLLEEKREELNVDKLKPIDVVKTVWKPCLPAVVVGTLSLTCLGGAIGVNVKRTAAVTAACALSETAYKAFADKTKEIVGEETVTEIKDAVIKEKMYAAPENDNPILYIGDGQVLCYDGVTGKEFVSTREELQKAENKLNLRMRNEIYISLNDYFYEIKLDTVSLGEVVGWHIDDGYLEFRYGSMLNKHGKPCLVVEPVTMPYSDYRDSHR
jgi:hypothetical protein